CSRLSLHDALPISACPASRPWPPIRTASTGQGTMPAPSPTARRPHGCAPPASIRAPPSPITTPTPPSAPSTTCSSPARPAPTSTPSAPLSCAELLAYPRLERAVLGQPRRHVA